MQLTLQSRNPRNIRRSIIFELVRLIIVLEDTDTVHPAEGYEEAS